MGSTVTYTGRDGLSATIPLWPPRLERGRLDLRLSRSVSEECPLEVVVLLKASGEVVHFASQWSSRGQATWWHFHNLIEDCPVAPATPGQSAAVARMLLGLQAMPGGLRGAPSKPVLDWALPGKSSEEIAAEHGVHAPALPRAAFERQRAAKPGSRGSPGRANSVAMSRKSRATGGAEGQGGA